MNTSRNLLVIVLMAASIVLLLVLEMLWLKNEFTDEKTTFTRNTYYLFSNTIISLQDSLVHRNAVPSAYSKFQNVLPDTINQVMQPDLPPRDRRNPDGVFRLVRPLILRLSYLRYPGKFLVKINGDSINMDVLNRKFSAEMYNAGIQLPFEIQVYKEEPDPSWVYAIHFENTGIYAVEKIMPQVLFCSALTLLILISFYSMYRNIRANQRLMLLKNDFISHITHELKTPVSTVSVAIEALRNFNVLKDPDKAMQYLEIASKELNRLDLMADKILSKTVFEQNGVEFQNELVDLKKQAVHVLDSMKLVFEKRKAIARLDKEDGSYVVVGSTEHLVGVIYNLVDNALKHSQPGVTIDVGLKSEKKYVELSVKDNGPGILPEYHKKIFDKFSRIPVGNVYNSKGYGLGLHYVRKVVESHNGTISLVSSPGTGSTFTIRIPRAHE